MGGIGSKFWAWDWRGMKWFHSLLRLHLVLMSQKHLEQIGDLTRHLDPRPAEPRTEQLNPSWPIDTWAGNKHFLHVTEFLHDLLCTAPLLIFYYLSPSPIFNFCLLPIKIFQPKRSEVSLLPLRLNFNYQLSPPKYMCFLSHLCLRIKIDITFRTSGISKWERQLQTSFLGLLISYS